MKFRLVLLGLGALLGLSLVISGTSEASTITDGNGVTYTLDGAVLTNQTATQDTYTILLEVDTSGYTGQLSAGDLLAGVALKLSAPAKLDSVDLLAGTTYDYDSVGLLGTNSSGCSGPSNGFGCADGTSADTVGGDYFLLWRFVVDSGTTLIDPASLKAVYTDASGNFVAQLSTTIVAPEPGTFGLVVLALLGLAGTMLWTRRAPRYTVS